TASAAPWSHPTKDGITYLSTVPQHDLSARTPKARAPVEGGVARLKSWRIFRKARCSPNRMTSIAAAVLTLERRR
ncbi:hypothetical protein ACWDSC_31030, partial [Streptomyces phaeochromogenes]